MKSLRIGGIIVLAFGTGVAAGAMLAEQRAAAVFASDVRACVEMSSEPEASAACVRQLAGQYAAVGVWD